MAITNIAMISEINEAKRIDPQFFHPEYTAIENKIKEKPHDTLGRLGKFITGPFGSAFHVENYVHDSPYRYIRGKDIKEFFLMNDDNVMIPEKDFFRLRKYALEPNDLLISVVGTLGNVCIVDSDELPAIFSSKSTAFRTDKIDIFFLAAYLNSKFGKLCLQRRARGAVQTGLNVEDLSSVPVVQFERTKQEEIGKMVKKALRLRKTSQKLYKKAKQKLVACLKLDQIKIENKKTFEVNFSEILSNKRMNPEFFNPTIKNILESNIINNRSLPLYQLFNIVRGKTPKKYYDKGIPILKTKNIREPEIDTDRINDFVSYSEERVNIMEKDLLMAVMGVGSLGRMSYVNKLNDQFCVDGTIRILRKREHIDKALEVPTMLYLSSEIGQKLIYRGIVGSTGIISLPDEYLAKIPIPHFDNELCDIVTQLVNESMQMHTESIELLNNAKREVENYILSM